MVKYVRKSQRRQLLKNGGSTPQMQAFFRQNGILISYRCLCRDKPDRLTSGTIRCLIFDLLQVNTNHIGKHRKLNPMRALKEVAFPSCITLT